MRSRFDSQLAQLNNALIDMGCLCEQAIAMATKALLNGSTELAEKVAPIDSEIDHKERDIEALCLKMLLQQQPVARDLRQISAALKMITDLERIGDQATDIAEITGVMKPCTENDFIYITDMAHTVIMMVTDSVDAYVKRDIDLVKSVIARDDEVDSYFCKAKKHITDIIAEDPKNGESALDLLMIAKYLERIGDHAENVAEWVEFSVTGVHKGNIEL